MIHWLLTKTPLLFLSQSFWRDEAFSYVLAKHSLFQIFPLTAKDFNPPLYYVLLHIYMWIFGHSEVMLRAFSLIFFNIMIYYAYRIIVDVFGKRSASGWTYLAMFAFNPFLMYYGLEARMYAMSACLATVSWYFLLTGRPRKWLLVTAAGLYTHYFFLLIVLSQCVYMLLSRMHTKPQKKKFFRLTVTLGITFLPWVLFVLLNRPPVGKAFWILPPTLYHILNTPAILMTGYEDILNFPNFSLIPYTILFLVVIIAGWRYGVRNNRDRDMLLFLVCWAFITPIATVILTPLKPLFLPRYMIVATPGLILLLLYMIMKMPVRIMRVGVLFLLFVGFFSYHKWQINYRIKDDFRGTLRTIKAQAAKDDMVYVDSELNFFTAQYYFDPNRVFIIGKSYDEIPDYTGKILIPRDRLASQPPRYPQKAFIIHDNLSYDIQSVY